MPLNFIMTDTAAEDQGIKCCVYGVSGVGKTTLAKTAPGVLIISAEAGLLSLRKEKLPGLRVDTVEDLTDIHQWLLYSNEAKAFQTIFMDSITEIAEVVLSNAKKLSADPRKAYGELIEKMTMTIKEYRDLKGKHVVMLAKQESSVDEITKITSYGPTMPGNKMGQALPYLFDEVFRLGIAQTTEGAKYRFLQTQPDMQYQAKDRSGALDPVEPPDLGVVFSKILARKLS